MSSALVLNAGSGTVGAAVFELRGSVVGDRLRTAKLTHHRDPPTLRIDDGDDGPVSEGNSFDALLDGILDGLGHDVAAVGHRIVHGGSVQAHSVLDEPVRAAIDDATAFAPLHNRPALELVDRTSRRLPVAIPVACLDTAFHVTVPDAAAVYGGPRRWWDEGLRRYGFHGISHHDASRRAATVIGRDSQDLALVTVHCGGGVSACAVDGGNSVDTTMGFTPAEGPIMATRSGTVDPGLIVHLLRHEGVDVDVLEDELMRSGGLLGLSGTSGDERELRERRGDDPAAALALDAYVHGLRAAVGSMLPSLGRLDGLVLTGDVLETDGELRRDLCQAFRFAGIEVDDERNAAWDGTDADLANDGTVPVVAVRADEEAAMARIVSDVLG